MTALGMQSAITLFGTSVLVKAETIRVLGKRSVAQGPVEYRHLNPRRHFGRYSQRGDFPSQEGWPGEPVPLDYDGATKPSSLGGHVLEPDFMVDGAKVVRNHARLRRLVCPAPRIGIIVGTTHRQEGTITPGGQGGPEGEWDDGYLNVWRDVFLLDVALQPVGSGKAWLATVLRSDVTEIPRG